MEHINVVLAPGETRTLPITPTTEPLYVGSHAQPQPRVAEPCLPCDLCAGLLPGNDMLLLLAVSVVPIVLGLAAGMVLLCTRLVPGVRGIANPLQQDVRMRIDRKYRAVATWNGIQPLTLLMLALTMFVPILVMVMKPPSVRQVPRTVLDPVRRVGAGTAVVTHPVSVYSNLGVTRDADVACSPAHTCFAHAGSRPCAPHDTGRVLSASAFPNDNALYETLAPWNLSDGPHRLCGLRQTHCPLQELSLQGCAPELRIDGLCHYGTCTAADREQLLMHGRVTDLDGTWTQLMADLMRHR
jgi:hypothetical protein